MSQGLNSQFDILTAAEYSKSSRRDHWVGGTSQASWCNSNFWSTARHKVVHVSGEFMAVEKQRMMIFPKSNTGNVPVFIVKVMFMYRYLVAFEEG
mmetsp:Transcript_113785/g.328593  ORF Transcript_113785/g.328593 Transcript_113785/m.328593 type:complete len:95 (-) Transcript_113785:310-594(-)